MREEAIWWAKKMSGAMSGVGVGGHVSVSIGGATAISFASVIISKFAGGSWKRCVLCVWWCARFLV